MPPVLYYPRLQNHVTPKTEASGSSTAGTRKSPKAPYYPGKKSLNIGVKNRQCACRALMT